MGVATHPQNIFFIMNFIIFDMSFIIFKNIFHNFDIYNSQHLYEHKLSAPITYSQHIESIPQFHIVTGIPGP